MNITFAYRLLPSKAQHRALENILESQRQLYNAALQERIDAYQKCRVTRTYFDQAKGLSEWRRGDPEAREMPLRIQRATLRRLDAAYKSFFVRCQKGLAGLPRFKGFGRFHTFGFDEFQGITLVRGCLRFDRMPGGLRVHFHRPLPAGSIRCCTFRRRGRSWTLGLVVATNPGPCREAVTCVGVDLGITNFAVLSDGTKIPSLRAARRAARKLRVAQRALSRKAADSRNREKARQELRLCYEAVARRRANHLHQASALLVRRYDVIAIEKLNVAAMAKGFLAKHVVDASWRKFISLLRYKAERAGVALVEVNCFGTSQECSACGHAVKKGLSERRHLCAHCGLSLDRDLNAARNVLHRAGVVPGLRNVALLGMRAGGNLGSEAGIVQTPAFESQTLPK